eukprot:COSAG01_NODE_5295_length_4352_cov_7.332236_7_plen_41_part_00
MPLLGAVFGGLAWFTCLGHLSAPVVCGSRARARAAGGQGG